MRKLVSFLFLICIIGIVAGDDDKQICEKTGITQDSDGTQMFNIRFPHVHTSKHDQYMCTSLHVPISNVDQFIVNFIPFAKASKAHHMLLYGCDDDISSKEIWDCRMGSVCNGKSTILYAWARNAKALKLPKDVGARIGKAADITNLVLQIHYQKAMKPGETDCSGLSFKVTSKPQKYYAGIYLLGATWIKVPAHQRATSPVSCVNEVPSTLHVFAFRTHAHELGLVNTAYRVRDGRTVMIGKGNPLWPEAFYTRVGGEIELKKGDKLLMRCDYKSNRNRTTFVGATGKDEMCNFYMMYYTKSETVASHMHSCWGDRLNIKLPSSASMMCPYPGYAGITSTLAIMMHKAKQPKVPAEMHMDNMRVKKDTRKTIFAVNYNEARVKDALLDALFDEEDDLQQQQQQQPDETRRMDFIEENDEEYENPASFTFNR